MQGGLHMERQYDLVIIGAGPAGLSAALYGSRAGLKTLILENGAPGGKLIKTNKISNYPGVKEIEGTQLAMDMFDQATSFQAEYAYGEVNKIDENKDVYLSDGSVVNGKAIILATGTKERLLNIPGEKENLGHGVSFCAVCDGAFFRDKCSRDWRRKLGIRRIDLSCRACTKCNDCDSKRCI